MTDGGRTSGSTTDIVIELGGAASALVDDAALAHSTIGAASAAVARLLSQLGLPAGAGVSLEAGPGPALLQVRVNGVRQGCELAQLERIARTLMAARGEQTWPEPLFADGWASDPRRNSALAEALGRASATLLGLVPQLVVTTALVSDVAGGSSVDLPYLSIVVRGLLGVGLPIVPRDLILRQVAAAHRAGVSAEDVTEFLISLVRPETIDVEIDPAYGLETTGLSMFDDTFGDAAALRSDVRDALASIADATYANIGVRVPPIRFTGVADGPPGGFRIRFGIAGQDWIGVPPERVLVDATAEALSAAGVAGSPAVSHITGMPCSTAAAADGARVAAAGFTVFAPIAYLGFVLSSEIAQHAACLVDIDGVERELATLRNTFPALVSAALERRDSRGITRVLRGLAAQQVSIRDLRTILEAIVAHDVVFVPDADARATFGDRLVLDDSMRTARRGPNQVEASVRKQLRRYLSVKNAAPDNTIRVYLLDMATVSTPIMAALAARRDPPIDELRRALLSAVDTLSPTEPRPAILASPSIAPWLRERLATEFPRNPVLSYEEIVSGMNLDVVQRVRVAPAETSLEKSQ
ncbi:MAG TPA: FHIPEP family type III secretion protein [Gemmatimonadaceae bacterium]|nr:FHIPEP family type III secretion protein [Gemmatimonadaceae bacterium]